MFSFKSLHFVVFALNIWLGQAEISDKRLCIDEKCSELIALGKTLLRYPSPEADILSFGPNEDVEIFSYGAGNREELIGVKLNGKRGYINKAHVKETKLIKRPKLEVSTKLDQESAGVPEDVSLSDIQANPTQEPFEIVDGTRIPLDLSTEAPVQETLSLNIDNENLDRPTPSTPIINLQLEKKLEDTQQILKEVTVPPPTVNLLDGQQNEEPQESNLPQSKLNLVDDKKLDETPQSLEEDGDAEEDDDDEEDIDDDEEEEEDSKENTSINETPLEGNNKVEESADKSISFVEKEEAGSAVEIENNTMSEVNEAVAETDPNSKETVSSLPKTMDSLQTGTPPSTVEEQLPIQTNTSSLVTEELAPSLPEASDHIPIKLEVSVPLDANDIVNANPPEELPPSLPEATTQIPIELEVSAPLDSSDIVTPDPLGADNLAEIPVEKPALPASGGIFGGLFGGRDADNVGEDNAELKDIPEFSADSNNENPSSHEETEIKTHEEAEIKTNEVDIEILEEKSDSGELGQIADVKEEPSGFISGFTSIFTRNSVDNKPEKKDVDNINEAAENTFSEESDAVNNEKLEKEIIAEFPNENLNTFQEASSSNLINEQQELCDGNPEKCLQTSKQSYCDKEDEDCLGLQENTSHQQAGLVESLTSVNLQDIFIEAFSSDMFLYLSTTSLSVLILIFIWILMDKWHREGPLIARINKLEQQLLATTKENEMLQENRDVVIEEKTQIMVEAVPNEVVERLNAKISAMAEEKLALEEQIQALERELDTSTEVGIELNKLISEMLNSSDGSEILKENIEQMQKRVLEQQDIINNLNETLRVKEMKSLEVKIELELSNKKTADLQNEVDRMVEKILKIEEEKEQQLKVLESEIVIYQNKCKEASTQELVLKNEILNLNQKFAELQRTADTKIKEYNTLKETLSTIRSVKNDKEALKSFLNVSEIKAQLEQMKSENSMYAEQLTQERSTNQAYTEKIQTLSIEVEELREKYEKVDKEKVEINTKLEVLNNYFKEKEDQMQKELMKYESIWDAKEGEATSTTERIKYMQEELQNYKSQNESLKQEIINQEVELKSQISVLEKKSHENWVTNRQIERKLEEAKQEAALLRNRLTMRERAIAESNNQHRMQSPLHPNGEMPISPPPLDPTQSPPPLYNPRDHMPSAPIPGMPPPPFLPPPPLGVTPFLPPPPLEGMMPPRLGDMGGMPPFMPLPGMFPGDHRPPPLGRMSSPPPVGGRYTPESTGYSEYDRYNRRSPSPPYDSEYGASPPPTRGYSPYGDRDDRRGYKKPQPRSNGRSSKGMHSSGSENDSLGKVNHKKAPHRKV
ncbi:unnamed protein product [Ceutorhynchus assimilis]|uniref:Transport and Golgi organization protein 1 n=1 Tax=Ceutorhynchus assimilis TaxID=467358 RepID=A0A9N9Q911_9CUCU|nr:unnamed protein product [Ceutorhynchus assimilis]